MWLYRPFFYIPHKIGAKLENSYVPISFCSCSSLAPFLINMLGQLETNIDQPNVNYK